MVRTACGVAIASWLAGAPAFAQGVTAAWPPPQPAFTWTGFYAGVNVGFTCCNTPTIDTTTGNAFGNPDLFGGTAAGPLSAALVNVSLPRRHNFLGGAQAGYNYQINRFVVGLETDFQGMPGSRSTTVFGQGPLPGFPTNPIDQTVTSNGGLDYLGTLRGRLGYAVTQTVLVFGTGGMAYGHAKAGTTVTQFVENAPLLPNPYTATGGYSGTRVGWTAGGGVEWSFLRNWSIRGEYLYVHLGSTTFALTPLQNFNTSGQRFTSNTPSSRVSFNDNVLRVVANYRF